MPNRNVSMLYRCGHEFRVGGGSDTSPAMLTVMRQQCADRECPECQSAEDDGDYMDVYARELAAERKGRGR